jgi:hypothetical protein
MAEILASYTHKPNAFSPKITWEVVATGLKWRDEKGKSGELLLGKITDVRLRHEPSRAETRRIGLTIHAPYEFAITNIDYKGPMNFKCQPEEFRNFVQAFHQIFAPDTQTLFHKGSTKGAFVFNIVITVLVLIFLLFLAPIISLTGIPGATSIFRIGMILLFLPLLLRSLRKNKPEHYQPDAPPMDMLE